MGRALGLYTATAWQTLGLLRPGDYRLGHIDERWRNGGLELADQQSALAWLEAERANLLAAAEQAATCPGAPAELAIQLAHALFAFLWVRGHWDDLVEINQTALAVAQRTGDRAAQGLTNSDLAAAYCHRGQPGRALACLRESLAIFQELGMPRGQAESLRALGETLRALDRLEEARAHWREALAIFEHLHTPDADEIRALLTAQPAGHTRQA